ncbi:hypothetical protein DVH24_011078 [Malus domestica]|uniref:Uncharacterized protein n=1 Tax=Malus domestica TaxID=3750 RepID=A0A498JXR1_MALDO|nr:hypothetical protein DVH24_011078 [Malus domestica]
MHVATGNYENLIVAGITDPTKVGFFIKYFMNRIFRRSNRWDRLKKVENAKALLEVETWVLLQRQQLLYDGR